MADSALHLNSVLIDARAGSSAALGDLLDACRGYLLGIAERELDVNLRAKGGASDLVQDTFLEAQRDFPRFEGATEGELLAWLRRMLLNNMHNFTRQYRGTEKRSLDREVMVGGQESSAESTPLLADTPTPSVQAMAAEDARALEASLAQLPPDYRDVLTYRYIKALSFEEIAARMGRSNNAVRQLWARAVRALQQEYKAP